MKKCNIWGQHEEVQKQVERLREAVVAALCDLEKHQSKCIESYEMNTNKYLNSIIQAVEDELQNFGLSYHSKVLFIGSGALPVSVLTIASNFGAKVMGVDIDSEAIASLVADKIKVLQQLNELVNEDVKILLRYGNGIKSILNYSFHYDFSGEWNQIQHRNQNLIYDTVILQKSSSKNVHKREYIEI